MTPQIIKICFIKDGKAIGRHYTYFSENPVTIGDVVQVNEYAKGLVVDIDIPEEEIADIKHLVKYIHGKLEERL